MDQTQKDRTYSAADEQTLPFSRRFVKQFIRSQKIWIDLLRHRHAGPVDEQRAAAADPEMKTGVGATPVDAGPFTPAADPDDPYRYFFIRGFMRSGTTWVSNLLNLHPKVSCVGEFYLNDLKTAIEEKLIDPYTKLSDPPVAEVVRRRFAVLVKESIRMANRLACKPDIVWFGERTPRPLEPLVLEDAHHFLCVRDPRDVLVSWTYHLMRIPLNEGGDPHDAIFENYPSMSEKKALFAANQTYFKENPDKLFEGQGEWVRSVAENWAWRIGSNMESLARINAGELRASVYLVRYETLLTDFEAETQRLFRFLDTDPLEAAPFNDLTTPGFARENFASHYRKGAAGDWKRYFRRDTCDWFKSTAGQALIDLGYETDLDWTNDPPA